MIQSIMEKEYKTILSNSCVLVVDDNEGFRAKFVQMLRLYFLEIFEASNGDEAIDIYHQKNPNIIFTDIKMPTMCGLTFIKFIRKINSQIPIVVFSAYSEEEILKDLISLNLIDFIDKPLEYERLQTILQKCAKSLKTSGLMEYNLTDSAKYSFSTKTLITNDATIVLTHKEMLFLELIIRNSHQVTTKEMVESDVYDGEYMSDTAISNLVSKIRKKVGENIIKTIPSVGFTLIRQ